MSSGAEVELRLMSLSDILLFRRWLDDDEIIRLAFGAEEISEETRRIAQGFKSSFFRNYLRFRSIKYRGETVGFINFAIISGPIAKVARIGIVIGRKDLWGKGIGTRALNLIIDYLFYNERVDVVQLDTATFNLRAQRAFKKVGFKEVSRDERRGKIYMEITREEYERSGVEEYVISE